MGRGRGQGGLTCGVEGPSEICNAMDGGLGGWEGSGQGGLLQGGEMPISASLLKLPETKNVKAYFLSQHVNTFFLFIKI